MKFCMVCYVTLRKCVCMYLRVCVSYFAYCVRSNKLRLNSVITLFLNAATDIWVTRLRDNIYQISWNGKSFTATAKLSTEDSKTVVISTIDGNTSRAKVFLNGNTVHVFTNVSSLSDNSLLFTLKSGFPLSFMK